MKKSKVIEIFNFLNGIKLNKITNKSVRGTIISNHMLMYNTVKQYEGDLKELQRKLFEGKEDRVQELNTLREEYKNTKDSTLKKTIENNIVSNFSDILSIEIDFNNEVMSMMYSEIDVDIKKFDKNDFIESCIEAEVDFTAGSLLSLNDLFE